MRLVRRLLGSLTLTLLVIGIGGCTDSPLSPGPNDNAPVGPNGPPLLTVEADGSAEWKPLTMILDPVLNPPTARALEVCEKIDGAVGGRIECGRFVLWVPPGAYDGTATICMSMSDSTVMVVDLSIDPITLNRFKVPVKLCLITEDAGVDEKDVSIYWFDPVQNIWSAMACDRDLSNDPEVTGGTYVKGVLTPLSHFSRYSGGKAGW